ncbi:MAG: hypothetical protein K9M54_08405, partial [Kiritimatiellales bacterium]|nr:hypothetical protein [Kiritimatiellales bacterium]
LLQSLANVIDLERIAHHRGSSFGRFTTPQPSQIDFENNLAWALVQHAVKGFRHVVLEDEGGNIGERRLPRPLVEYYQNSPLVILERPLAERVQVTFDEYVTTAQIEYRAEYGDESGIQHWLADMDNNIDRIQKRLGGLRCREIKKFLHAAHESGDPERHKVWIEPLLRNYYDPMYDYQIGKRSQQVVLRGNASEVLEYLQHLR